ncbi:MAG: hypothetical protein ACLU4N_27995 [Butyricimonas faecihominis]
MSRCGGGSLKQVLRKRPRRFEEDAAACRKIGEHGLSLLKPRWACSRIVTRASGGFEYGTALAPIYLGQEQGFGFSVFADETRPLLQGARLTASELQKAGADVTLICDNMASSGDETGMGAGRAGWV